MEQKWLKNIRMVTPYTPGEQPKNPDVIKLNTNENPYPPAPGVLQAIRDAMNLSGTSSIDEIINDYGYYGSTSIEPNADVKAAVSYIFDENGSAVQHRVLCFYIGSSAWHETQNFASISAQALGTKHRTLSLN